MSISQSNHFYDVVIVGSGASGGTLAYALTKAGHSVALIERGKKIPAENDNWSVPGIMGNKYVVDDITGRFKTGRSFLGGETKIFGAALYRLRKNDFAEVQHVEGISPAWPISYEDMEPYYTEAERIYRVRGSLGEDITEPFHSEVYQYPAISHEIDYTDLIDSIRKQGLNVSSIPRAIDYGSGGKCILCNTCDGFPCKLGAKMDVEEACIKPALKSGKLQLYTEVECERIVTDESGKHVLHAEVRRGNEWFTIRGSMFVISSGTYHSPALLFKSRNANHPNGLANSSGQLGKNLCGHNAGLLLVPTRQFLDNNHQKTFAINDFYFGKKDFSYPMGIAQATGRFPIWEGLPQPFKWITKTIAQRSLLMLLMTESLPDEHNRIEMDESGKLILHYKANNLAAYTELKKTFMQIFRKAGYFMTINAGSMTDKEPWAAVGTARIGNDPKKFVLNKWCQSYDVSNLYVVDGSSLPSNGSLNASLTLIAQALRVGEHLNHRLREVNSNFSQVSK